MNAEANINNTDTTSDCAKNNVFTGWSTDLGCQAVGTTYDTPPSNSDTVIGSGNEPSDGLTMMQVPSDILNDLEEPVYTSPLRLMNPDLAEIFRTLQNNSNERNIRSLEREIADNYARVC